MTTQRGKRMFPVFYIPSLEELLTENECLSETIQFCKTHGLEKEAEALTVHQLAILQLAEASYSLKKAIDDNIVSIRLNLPTELGGWATHE